MSLKILYNIHRNHTPSTILDSLKLLNNNNIQVNREEASVPGGSHPAAGDNVRADQLLGPAGDEVRGV